MPPLSAGPMSKIQTLNASFLNSYISLEIGTGAFGAVHRCVEKSTGRTFAAKFIATPSAAEKSTVRRECDTMNRLIHRRLLNLHDVFDEGDEMCLVTEFLSGGELFERLGQSGYKMTGKTAFPFFPLFFTGWKSIRFF